jgi:APA family basic amino acid/polyamine antiporter
MGSPGVGDSGKLKQGVSLSGIIALGAGTAIGVSIFSVIAPGATLAGSGMLLSLVVASVPMILFAVTYAYMGSAVPVSGASYEWSRRFIHPFAGFIIGWLRIAGSTAALIVLSLVLVQYWSMMFALPLKPTMIGLLALFYVLNTLGVSLVAGAQTVMVILLLVTCGLLAGSAVPVANSANFSPLLTHGWGGVFAAVPLMVSLFLGIEAATEVGEEVRDSKRTIPLGIALSILLTTVIYLAVAGAAIGVLGPAGLEESEAPLLDLAHETLGAAGMPLILLSATVAIGTSLNAIFLIFSRSLFAMSRSGILPAPLSRVHGRWGTPYLATTAAFLLCCAGLLLPSNLIFLFLAVNIPTLLKYGSTCVAAFLVVNRHPAIHERAAFRFRPAIMQAWALAGAACALVVILLGLMADWRPYAVLTGWALAGIGYYLVRNRSRAAAFGGV